VLIDCDNAAAADKISEIEKDPGLALVLEWARDSTFPLRLDAEASFLELAGTSDVEGRPNRCLMKCFPVSGGRYAAFFYKRSLVPFSRDRFAYGAVIRSEKRLSREGAEEWFRWLDGGFHPDVPPGSLKRAFSFDVPD